MATLREVLKAFVTNPIEYTLFVALTMVFTILAAGLGPRLRNLFPNGKDRDNVAERLATLEVRVSIVEKQAFEVLQRLDYLRNRMEEVSTSIRSELAASHEKTRTEFEVKIDRLSEKLERFMVKNFGSS